MKARVLEGLPEEYKPMIVSCIFNIPKMAYNDLKK